METIEDIIKRMRESADRLSLSAPALSSAFRIYADEVSEAAGALKSRIAYLEEKVAMYKNLFKVDIINCTEGRK